MPNTPSDNAFDIGGVAVAEGRWRRMLQCRPSQTPLRPGIIEVLYNDPTHIHLHIEPTILILFDIYHFSMWIGRYGQGGRALQGHERDDVSHSVVRRVMCDMVKHEPKDF